VGGGDEDKLAAFGVVRSGATDSSGVPPIVFACYGQSKLRRGIALILPVKTLDSSEF
jgi:hypothetical protein